MGIETTETNGMNGAANGTPGVPPPVPGTAPGVAAPPPGELPLWMKARMERAAKTAAEKAREEERAKVFADLGISDPEKFKADITARDERLREFERTEEERKRAQMSEVEKLRADLAQKEARIAELEAQLAQKDNDIAASKFDAVVQSSLDPIDESMREDAIRRLRAHVRSLPKDQQRKFGQAEVRAYFGDLVKQNSRWGRTSNDPPPPKPPPKRVPLTNGSPPKPRSDEAKTGAPLKGALDLTADEVRAKYAKLGIRPPAVVRNPSGAKK